MTRLEKGDIVMYEGMRASVLGTWHNQASISFVHDNVKYVEMVDIDHLTLVEKGGSLSRTQKAEKAHIGAMRTAAKREMSYVEALEGYGYIVNMQSFPIMKDDKQKGIKWEILISLDEEILYKAIFIHDWSSKREMCPHMSTCSYLHREDFDNEEDLEMRKMWRCRWRWADIFDCHEGPRYQPKLEYKDTES